MTKLVITNFYDPEPKREQFEVPAGMGDDLNEKEYQRAHNEWKRRQQFPGYFGATPTKEEIETREYYEAHRLKYKGFKAEYIHMYPGYWEINGNGLTIVLHESLSPHRCYGTPNAEFGQIEIRTDMNQILHFISSEGISVEEFDMLTENRGIKLEKT